MNAANDFLLTTTDADVQVAVGGGYGRELDIGAAIRVRRLSRTLDANRALGKPIDAATSRKLQLTWWALRAERSTYRALIATIAILRESGVLLGEPDAGLTYEILNVLRDSYLYTRPSGFDANLEFAEGYLRRPAGDRRRWLRERPRRAAARERRLRRAARRRQARARRAPGSRGSACSRRWASRRPTRSARSVTATRFTYGEHGDPFGTFDLTGTAQYSSDDEMMVDAGFSIAAQLGFTYIINQASGLRLAGQVAEDDGSFLFGATLTATYGLLDGTFAR